jgi:N-glycosylase/DNA lyase
MSYDRVRAKAIGEALIELGPYVFEAIDHADPGRPVLTEAAKLKPPYGLLVGLALALCDYQPGPGGSDRYCADALDELRRPPLVSDQATLSDFIRRVLRHASAARFNTATRARAERLIQSGMPKWLESQSISEVGQHPLELWKRLATTMNQPMHAKTIAAGVKVFDLLHKIETGTYVSFPAQVPILVDLRIARASLASGLLGYFDPQALEQLMVGAQRVANLERTTILSGWAGVSAYADDLSVLRIDGLLWQVATQIHELRDRPAMAAASVASGLCRFGAPGPSATRLGAELTYALRKK